MTALPRKPKQTTIDEQVKRRKSSEGWKAHDKVFLAARKQGACFDCATRLAFAATDTPKDKTKTDATLCDKCRRSGVKPTTTKEVQ